MERMFETGGWVEDVEEKEMEEQDRIRKELEGERKEMSQEEVEREVDEEEELQRLERQDEEDFVEEEEVRQRIKEVQETVDPEGNMVLGDLPIVVGETVAWPQNPTEAQLETPIGHDLKEYVRGRGTDFERAVLMEAGGEEVTLGMLIQVVRAWQEDGERDEEEEESLTSMSVLLEETREEVELEERGGDVYMGTLGLCLLMIARNRQQEDEREEREEQESNRMEAKELDWKELDEME